MSTKSSVSDLLASCPIELLDRFRAANASLSPSHGDAGTISEARNDSNRCDDELAVLAVISEPVSGAVGQVTGKFTGKFAENPPLASSP